MISSSANQKVKQIISLLKKNKARKEQGLYVVEGIRMFQEIPIEQLQSVYVSESFYHAPENQVLMQEIQTMEVVSDAVFQAMSDTRTPQGILALAKQNHYCMEDILGQPGIPHLLLLETLQDPGNLGTIVRAGEGAGITGVIMDRHTADIYNPKVIRSTMGSIYRVPFLYVDCLQDVLPQLKVRGIRLYAAHLKGKRSYDEENYQTPTGFLIGNEAAGICDETAALTDAFVKIPMMGRVESLNAAVAASILMYETARQRRGL